MDGQSRQPARRSTGVHPSLDDLNRRRRFLAQQSGFVELGSQAIALLAERMTERQWPAGEAILRQGDPGDSLLVLMDGTAEVQLRKEAGDTHALATLWAGDVLGEMALITDSPRNADVVAMTDVTALVLAAEDFRSLTEMHPEILALLTNIVAQRLGRAAVDGLGDKVLEGYQIRRPCGRGAMAVVYEGESLATGERVALKMLSHRLTLDAAAMARFEQEADLVASLRSPALTHCHGRFPAYGTCFMVMEFCDGPSLHSVISHASPLPERDVRRIIGSLALALQHVHGVGVVHGDIKPANVMLGRDGSVKLTDFGIASALHGTAAPDTGASAPIVGTPWYMAPEQFFQAPPAVSGDLYALGCLAYELITGRPLFEQKDLPGLLAAKRSYAVPPAVVIRPGLAKDIYRVLEMTLCYDPADRGLDLERVSRAAGPVSPELVARTLAAADASGEDPLASTA